jgi:hypothetical protein
MQLNNHFVSIPFSNSVHFNEKAFAEMKDHVGIVLQALPVGIIHDMHSIKG